MTHYAKKLPLTPILDLVSQDLAAEEKNELKFLEDTDNGDPRTLTIRQSPNFTSTLRGPVFFSNEAQNEYKRRVLSGL